jgi:hypothetical protein
MTDRTWMALLVAAGILLPVAAASGEDNIYAPGTDCANLPTIAERLLCGRQEFRRNQSNTSVEQPIPPSPEQPTLSPAIAEDPRIATPQEGQQRTASPND